MKKLNKDELLLCELQATAFENSIDKMASSSGIFIRRFMKSKIAKSLDNESVLESNIQAKDILQMIDEEYGVSNYGTVKYTHNEMYWIAYDHNIRSRFRHSTIEFFQFCRIFLKTKGRTVHSRNL